MSRRTTHILKAALSALYYSGADGIAAPFTRGDGVIFMLHRVTPEPVRAFEPNRILKITPDFLESVIRQVLDAGFEFLTLDEVPARLAQGRAPRPFACFTLDDGYRDNLQYALPIFRRFGVPFTVYVPCDYADGRGDLWWLMLERAIAASDSVHVHMEGGQRRFVTATTAEKDLAYNEIYWWLRRLPELEARQVVAALAAECGFSSDELCRELVMSWDEVRQLAADPLATIGAHTCSHLSLAKLDADTARREMKTSIERIESEIGGKCRHFSYPYGCEQSAGEREFEMARQLGVETAVTTRKGLVYGLHSHQNTALPRFSLNGDFQDQRYVKVMLSGIPFKLWNALGRVAGSSMAT